MRRRVAALLASLFVVGLVGPAVGAAPVDARETVPKVVIVVGPSGVATDRYRREARSAAALAREYTPDVTELYSPDATWPAVRKALKGASVVIYMGHGNGWPSRYRDSLYGLTQNGFGLNPEAGSGDDSHQYFGEARIAEHVRLARNAVVLLNHLCYASGNSEPGVAEGTLAQARQRVDNFAAGFIKAGAAAVVAEAYAGPNHMLKAVLAGDRSIESAWRRAPSRNGNAFAFESERSRGYVAQMDPEHGDSGFTRSIVLKAGLAPEDVLRNARGSDEAPVPVDPGSLEPSLTAAGIEVEQPFLDSSTAAGSRVKYKFRYEVEDRKALPKTIMASARWDPLDPIGPDPATEVAPPEDDGEAAPADTAEGMTEPVAGSEPPTTGGDDADEPSAAASDDPGQDPGAEASDDQDPAEPTGPPDLGLVTPERLGDVVEPVKVKIAKTAMAFKLDAPTIPGRYRLTVTLHDEDGVAFDDATQALFRPLIVRVTGELDAQVMGPDRAEVAAGGSAALDLWVANLGSGRWGHGVIDAAKDPDGHAPATFARVTGQWLALGDQHATLAAAAAAVEAADLPAGMEPGAVVRASLQLFAPSVPGDYLLILDIETPERGSVVASGLEPTIIRVRVSPRDDAAPAGSAPAGSAAPTQTADPQ